MNRRVPLVALPAHHSPTPPAAPPLDFIPKSAQLAGLPSARLEKKIQLAPLIILHSNNNSFFPGEGGSPPPSRPAPGRCASTDLFV